MHFFFRGTFDIIGRIFCVKNPARFCAKPKHTTEQAGGSDCNYVLTYNQGKEYDLSPSCTRARSVPRSSEEGSLSRQLSISSNGSHIS